MLSFSCILVFKFICVYSLFDENKKLEKLNFSSLLLYQETFNYEIEMEKFNELNNTLTFLSSDMIFNCANECNLQISSPSLYLVESRLFFQGIYIKITKNDFLTEFSLDLKKNSTLSIKVNLFNLI